MAMPTLHLLGYASGLAGADNNNGKGPLVVRESAFLKNLAKEIPLQWDAMLIPEKSSGTDVAALIAPLCEQLATCVSMGIQRKEAICVIGGDHTSAIGTWSGAFDALKSHGDIGLIWVDAHMDSHTPETSESGNVHGMPVACLLGHGSSALTSILHKIPKFKPKNVCLIGVRSFESGEAEFLKRMKVRVYFMDEVKERGFKTVVQEATEHVSKNTVGYGLSLDLDSLDPEEVPAVDVPEPDGIPLKDLYNGLDVMLRDPRLIATEIVEFDPKHDINQKTEKIIVDLIRRIANRNIT